MCVVCVVLVGQRIQAETPATGIYFLDLEEFGFR
jgi:hypothetical protein